jgi:hypothetical protein
MMKIYVPGEVDWRRIVLFTGSVARGKMNLGVPPEEVPLEESVDALDVSVKKHSALRSGRCSKGRSHKFYDHL